MSSRHNLVNLVTALCGIFQIVLRDGFNLPATAAGRHQHRHAAADALRKIAAKDSAQRRPDHPVGARLRQTLRARQHGQRDSATAASTSVVVAAERPVGFEAVRVVDAASRDVARRRRRQVEAGHLGTRQAPLAQHGTDLGDEL